MMRTLVTSGLLFALACDGGTLTSHGGDRTPPATRDAGVTTSDGGPFVNDDAGFDELDAAAPPVGVDAGASDAGTPGVDAGPPGVDAGPPGVDAGPPAIDAGPPPPTACATAEEAEVIALVNEARTSMGLGMVRCDEAMARTARKHSQDMCTQDYFSHTGLDGSSPFDRMRREGVTFRTAGENIAWGQRTPDDVHTAWMNSSGHRANILNGAYGRIGVGLESCGGRPYWTQVFAD